MAAGSQMVVANPVLATPPFRVMDSNVFLMTPYRARTEYAAISDAVEDAVRAFGLELLRADDPDLGGEMLWEKVTNCMEASRFGVALFDGITDSYFNPNVSLELGYMKGLKDRHLLLLKDNHLEKLPADLLGSLYREFDSDRIRPTVLGNVAEWLKSTRVRKLASQKVVVFVSYGGTDRCAMAKAITRHLLEQRNFTLPYAIESRAAFGTSGSKAADVAIEIVKRKLGKDWLSDHRPRRAGAALLFEADLILALDRRVLTKLLNSFNEYPGSAEERDLAREEIQGKTHLLSAFFGQSGDVDDPYPDRGDSASYLRYEAAFDQIYELISSHFDRIEDVLESPHLPHSKVRSVSFGDARLYGTT